jgi:hypothetical protein
VGQRRDTLVHPIHPSRHPSLPPTTRLVLAHRHTVFPPHTCGYCGDVAAIAAVLIGDEPKVDGQGGGHVIFARTRRMYAYFHYIDLHTLLDQAAPTLLSLCCASSGNDL